MSKAVMRILILGAGGVGGYFGARLHAAGGDVTFLVRPARAAFLEANGLRVKSPLGDVRIEAPRIVLNADPRDPYDLIVLSCKAYDFAAAVEAVEAAVGPESRVLPLLNGVAHLEALDRRFGRQRVWGGVAHLALTLTPEGHVEHLNGFHRLIFGPRVPGSDETATGFARILSGTSVEFQLSDRIEQDLWDKFVFLATLAGATCTMRASIGEILDTIEGESFILGLLAECEQTAAAGGHAPDPARLATYRSQLTERGAGYTASMLRDMERGGPTEADHVLGDMVRRAAEGGVDAPRLRLAYSHLQAYEARRRRASRIAG